MKQKYWTAVLALALTLALLAGCLSGCAKPEETPPAASSAPIQAPEIELSSVTDPFLATAGLSADTVVASAGEVDITAGLLLYWVASRADTLMSYYGAYGGLTELPWDTEIEGVTLAQSILSDALETSLLYALLPRNSTAPTANALRAGAVSGNLGYGVRDVTKNTESVFTVNSQRLEELKTSGVTVVVLLAIADGGKPYYDAQTAQRVAAMDIPCFACAPEKLPELLERALKGQGLEELSKEKKS